MARSKKPVAASQKPASQGQGQLYTLEVFIISGPVTEKFVKKNPVISRTIQIRGDQTLELGFYSFQGIPASRWRSLVRVNRLREVS